MSATGHCMCGGVTYSVDAPLRDVWNCHCFRCRRFTGHHMAATRADVADVTIEGDSLRWYSPDDTVAYGFCGICGSSLFWRASDRPQFLTVCAGTLHQPTGLRTTTAWWVAEHGDYHAPDTALEQHAYDG
ncbi:MAG: GFA family protein [Ilumatobacteraceae bacterium]